MENPMKPRIRITKSKSGHYSVTVRGPAGMVTRERKIADLARARLVAERMATSMDNLVEEYARDSWT